MIGAALFSFSPWGRQLDFLCYDALFYLRGAKSAPEDIVIVAVDEPSFAALQSQWPWSRALHARLLDALFEAGAKTVAFDILFSEPGDPFGDEQLAQSLAFHPGTLLASCVDTIDDPGFLHSSVISPMKTLLSDSGRIGGIDLPSDPDGFVRRAIPRYGSLQGLSFRASHLFSSGQIREHVENIVHSEFEVWINFIGPPRSIKTVSYYQALEPSRYLPKNFFRNKLVFVGLALQIAPEIDRPHTDHFSFPFSRGDGKMISGVEIHATVASNLLSGDLIRPIGGTFAWIGLIWVLGYMAIVLSTPRNSYIMTGFLLLASMGSSTLLFFYGNRYFPFIRAVLPVSLGALSALFPSLIYLRRDKRLIRNIFSRYVSPEVVNTLIDNPDRLRLGGDMVDATVLYLDIAGFSDMAVRMTPEALVEALSRYLGSFSDIILSRNGMVDKFVGDAIMAVWGVPLPQPDHPERACRTALEILRALENFRQVKTVPATESISIRIGINSGRMLAGNVGGKRFLNYTVHGEATNLAVRLEAVNKIYGTRILLGQDTAKNLGSEFIIREVDSIRLVGQSGVVTLFELAGLSSDVAPIVIDHWLRFEAARHLYLDRRFVEAREAFSRLLSDDPTDGPSHIYFERCRRFMEDPPPDSWNRVAEIRLK